MQNTPSALECMKNLKSKTCESAYIHIPFCKRKCNYCAFTSLPALNLIDNYIKKLTIEIKKYYSGVPLKTLYIGGGTPSLLDIKHFKKILSLFKYASNPEITVEINPDSANLNFLNNLYELGVNRLSIGVQSFNDDILKAIGRLHTSKRAKDTVYLAQDVGFKNISIDLIYGLPLPQSLYDSTKGAAQNLKLWKEDLKEAKNLDIQHISLYGLKIEENTPFCKNLPKHLPNDDMQADMYEFAIEYLTPEFKLYEISNFTRTAFNLSQNTPNKQNYVEPDFTSKHNLNYWNEGEYFGFGLSASGFLNGIRYQNTKNFMEYIENPCTAKELTELTKEEKLEETIFLGFRKKEGINIHNINEKFNIDFNKKFEPQIEKFIKTGHLEQTENGYRLTIKGILISNLILSEFLL